MKKFFYFSFNLTNPIKLIKNKIIKGNQTESIIGIFLFSQYSSTNYFCGSPDSITDDFPSTLVQLVPALS